MIPGQADNEYVYHHGEDLPHHEFLLPVLRRWLGGEPGPLLDIGSGNGSLTATIHRELGLECFGIERSLTGVAQAKRAHPDVTFQTHSIGQPLPDDLRSRFSVVIAMEVVEHLYLPAQLFQCAQEALAPGGRFIVSTPYHGYLKNVVIAVSGKFDAHVNPTLDHGHIKFFSPATLEHLAKSAGWRLVTLERAGRIPPLAKSMLATFKLAEGQS